MCDLFPYQGAGGPSRIPLFLTGLLLCGALLFQAATPVVAVPLNWADVLWNNSEMSNTYRLSNGVDITITVARAPGTIGSFEFSSPREDCSGCTPPRLFGTTHNLAVVFDPDPTQPFPAPVVSPILITLLFSRPIDNLAFEISDIDFSESAFNSSTHRLDRVAITGNNEAIPTLSPKPLLNPAASHTFSIAGNTATAQCTGGQPTCNPANTAPPNSDAGTVLVDFGAQFVSEVTITYTEAGNAANPSSRGIGLLGNTELTPVELMSFSVE